MNEVDGGVSCRPERLHVFLLELVGATHVHFVKVVCEAFSLFELAPIASHVQKVGGRKWIPRRR